MKTTLALVVACLATAPSFPAQTKWDLPTGYATGSFQTENVQAFANDVDKATAGKLKITLHANGSLYKGERNQTGGADGSDAGGRVHSLRCGKRERTVWRRLHSVSRDQLETTPVVCTPRRSPR